MKAEKREKEGPIFVTILLKFLTVTNSNCELSGIYPDEIWLKP
jgi:hypothetical protein